MYIVETRNKRTGKWHRVNNSHTASLSGIRVARPSRTMRFGGVARAWVRDLRRDGWEVRLRKVDK